MAKYLICVGAAKAGTTLLYELLRAHPALAISSAKEVHYFDRCERPSKDSYDALFSGSGIKFDVTPIYMYDQQSMERIAKTLGAENVKVVVLLRDPVDRALSHYNMVKGQGRETLSFEESFWAEPARIAQGAEERRIHSYFARGKYARQLDNIYRMFPRERVHVVMFEHFVKHQQQVVDGVTDFAGIARLRVQPLHANKTIVGYQCNWLAHVMQKVARKMPRALKGRCLRALKGAIDRVNDKPAPKEELSPAFARALYDNYQADIRALEAVYHLDTGQWKRVAACRGEEEGAKARGIGAPAKA
ncbi:MAG: sulfotransferase [Clostridia bacterium]